MVNHDEQIVKVLGEIRDLQKENMVKYEQYMKQQEEKYNTYLEKHKQMTQLYLKKAIFILGIFFLVGLVVILF